MSSKPKMDLAGHDGNIYSILGRASRLLKQEGQPDRAQEMWDRVLDSKSYNEALGIISEYVETELSPAAELKKTARKKNSHER